MTKKILIAIGFCFSVAQVSSAAPQVCPDLSGIYTCTDNLGQAPWTYHGTQYVNENGHTVYNGIVVDGIPVQGGDPESGTSYIFRAYCESGAFWTQESGVYPDENGVPVDYDMGSKNYLNRSGHFISEVFYDGELVKINTCIKHVKP